jgi:hypothetical protein
MTKKGISLWTAFAVMSVLTPIVYKTAYALPGYWVVLSCLGIAAFVFAAMALRYTGLKVWSVVAAVGGLLIGQWWLFQFLILMAFWKWRGFGP